MTKNDLVKAFEIARSTEDLSQVDDSIFWGFGLRGFQPVYVTLRQVAKLIRWQTFMFNGEIDAAAMNEIAVVGRSKFMVIG